MKLVIVESPAKAKTINKYLGKDYEVMASYGHIRDLPSKDGSVDPNNDFAMIWDAEPKAAKRISEITKAADGVEKIVLATDPDREGEAISWHLAEILKSKKNLKSIPIERVAFNAITKESVLQALSNPRAIDQNLVDAYLARRALDYLVGFTLSPVLWRKLPGARSAGRVQSVALRLVCERESEIEKFISNEYWSVQTELKTSSSDALIAKLIEADGKKITRLDITTETQARLYEQQLKTATYEIKELETKPVKRNPYPPFTTSTLQQEASRKLNLSPARTMQLAQKLYEGLDIGGETVGLITYMRTDGVDITPEAVQAIRAEIQKRFGDNFVASSPRMYKTKTKNAQEAHEAIRPTNISRAPESLKAVLDKEMLSLYELIWKRTMACQMEQASLERTTADILAKSGTNSLTVRAVGSVLKFPGFLSLYEETSDDNEDDESKRLPPLKQGEALSLIKVEADQHFTEPPPRFTEASLVKRMEELGIGRPSTYASTLAVLRDRGYVKLDKKRLSPEDKGRLVTSFLENFFNRYVEYDFTANLEEQLDSISNHEANWKDVLRMFWTDFSKQCEDAKETRTTVVLDALSESLESFIFPNANGAENIRKCPTCENGTLSLKIGKFGSFVGCSNYPECRFTRQLGQTESTDDEGKITTNGVVSLGTHPESGLEITLRDGRFGPYVQEGEGDKPKRQSLPKGIDAQTLTFERALALINLPRTVGEHPEDKQPVLAGLGRYGPYLQHGALYAKLDNFEDVFTVGLNRAVDLIANRKSGAGGAAREQTPAQILGQHPDDSKNVSLKSGRFGPYVEHGSIRASLPRAINPESITLDQALELIAKKAANPSTGFTKKGRSNKTAKPKKAAKK